MRNANYKCSSIKPYISIILPVFNGEKTLEKAIYSLGSLSGIDAELIIIDDGSTDGTHNILNQIKKHLSGEPIKVIRTRHIGVADAANMAISYAKGDWIARIDADDWSSPHRLRQQLSLAQNENLDIVSCFVKIVTPDGFPVISLQDYEQWLNSCVTPEDILASRFIELPIPNPTILAKREVFELGFRNGNYPEDYDLWLRAMSAGFRPGKVPRTLYWWTDHPNRVTRTQSIYTKAAFLNAKKLHLFDGPLAGVTECDFWGAGLEGKPWIRWFLNQGIKIRNIIDVNPNKVGQVIHGSQVILPERINTTPPLPLFIGVGVPEGRKKIKDFILSHLPHTPGQDAWFLA